MRLYALLLHASTYAHGPREKVLFSHVARGLGQANHGRDVRGARCQSRDEVDITKRLKAPEMFPQIGVLQVSGKDVLRSVDR